MTPEQESNRERRLSLLEEKLSAMKREGWDRDNRLLRAERQITLLWSGLSVGTSGNPPVKRRPLPKKRHLPDLTGKPHAGRLVANAWLGAPLLHCESLRIMV